MICLDMTVIDMTPKLADISNQHPHNILPWRVVEIPVCVVVWEDVRNALEASL